MIRKQICIPLTIFATKTKFEYLSRWLISVGLISVHYAAYIHVFLLMSYDKW